MWCRERHRSKSRAGSNDTVPVPEPAWSRARGSADYRRPAHRRHTDEQSDVARTDEHAARSRTDEYTARPRADEHAARSRADEYTAWSDEHDDDTGSDDSAARAHDSASDSGRATGAGLRRERDPPPAGCGQRLPGVDTAVHPAAGLRA